MFATRARAIFGPDDILAKHNTVIVGRDTLLTPVTGFPAIRPLDTSTVSGPAGTTAAASGGVPGNIATCTYPSDGCQVGV